jgi:hypothetical protein
MVMVAPGTAWLDSSTTLPDIDPDVVCAVAVTALSSSATTESLKQLIAPPRCKSRDAVRLGRPDEVERALPEMR